MRVKSKRTLKSRKVMGPSSWVQSVRSASQECAARQRQQLLGWSLSLAAIPVPQVIPLVLKNGWNAGVLTYNMITLRAWSYALDEDEFATINQVDHIATVALGR